MKAKLDNYFKAFHDNDSTLDAKDLLTKKAIKTLYKYVPLFVKSDSLPSFQEWSSNMLETMGIDPSLIDVKEVYKRYVASTASNPKKLDSDVIELKNTLNDRSIYSDYAKSNSDIINNVVSNTRKTTPTAFNTFSTSKGKDYKTRINFLKDVKDEIKNSFNDIVTPYALATALDKSQGTNVTDYMEKHSSYFTLGIPVGMFKSDEIKEANEVLDDIVDNDVDTVVKSVDTELPKEEPKAELSMSSPSAMFNKNLTKPYSPNLSMHYDILMNEYANKNNDLDISTPDSTVDIPVSTDDKNDLDISTPDIPVDIPVSTDAIPDSNNVDSATYIKNMQDYLENLKDRKKVIQDILTNNNIITEEELNEITGVDKIITGMNKAFIALNNRSITNLSKSVIDEIQKQMQYVKDVITKYGSRLQNKYKLEAKLKNADDKVETLMQELKRNNNIEYLLKLPTNVYEMLPSEVKLACDQYMRKQIELTHAIKARKSIISKKALTQQIEPSKIQYVINPMLNKGYSIFNKVAQHNAYNSSFA